MEDIAHWIHVPTLICEYIYLAFIIYCFLLSMGNRPQGNRIGYLVSMIVFGFVMLILVSFVVFLAYWSIKKEVVHHKNAEILTDGVFVRIVISVLSTYGIWLLASLMFLDPWHIFTSLFQYILVSPSFINVINIYAFCNTHDVSWGTKGSTTLSMDLGQASGTCNDAVEVTVPDRMKDIDAAYDDACQALSSRESLPAPPRDTEQAQKDYYATVRTNVVLAWTLTNVALVIVILNVSRKVHNIYMAVLFYTFTSLAFFRFLGAFVYLVRKLFP